MALLDDCGLALYGARDAASLRQKCLSQHFEYCGFSRDRSNPCVFYNAEKDLNCLVHGDDYATVGSLDSLSCMRAKSEGKFDMKTTIVGHSSGADVVSERANIETNYQSNERRLRVRVRSETC